MEPERKPFAAFITEQRRGGLHGELSEALQLLVLAVDEHRKAGTLTLTLKIQPNGDGIVTVTDKVVVKAPEGERGSAIFFVDSAGNLVRNDPRQLTVDDAVAEARARKAVGDE